MHVCYKISRILPLLLLLINRFGNSELVEIGKYTYDVNYILYHVEEGNRVVLVCDVPGQVVDWYKHDFNGLYTREPVIDCINSGSCELENRKNNSVLVIKELKSSLQGPYLCIDGNFSQGFTVEMEKCVLPTPTLLSLDSNQTVSRGQNATFTCILEVGRESCSRYKLDIIHKDITYLKNGMPRVNMSARISEDFVDRRENGGILNGYSVTLYTIRPDDYGTEVHFEIYVDMHEDTPFLCSGFVLDKASTILERQQMNLGGTLGITLPLILVAALFIVCCCVFNAAVKYLIAEKRNKLPDIGDRLYHGLILYDGEGQSYEKVCKLQQKLPQYKFKEYPPASESSDPTAGYERFALLDELCQQCACVIIMGDVGDIEERCLPLFQGVHVTHVLLSKPLSRQKKINLVQWPSEAAFAKNIRWLDFLYKVRTHLPKSENRYGTEEQMLTQI